MQTRYRAAATALLLTATAGMTATGGTAEASGSHTSSTRAATKLVVTIKSTADGPVLSTDSFRPGKTLFNVVRRGDGGSMEILRLKPGYTIQDLANDFPLLFQGDVQAVRRVDKNVVFYGGMGVPKKRTAPPSQFGADIDKAGTYYVVNIRRGNLTTFKAKGTHQTRSLPAADGWINPATAPDGTTNIWKAGKNNPNKGWMRTTNHAKEPHFVEMDHVKASTTNQQVQDFFDSGAQGEPAFVAKDHAGIFTEVVSPGHTVLWKYHTSKGKYLAMCFYPSKVDGTPHAFMGMWKLTNLG